jgi:hypothetical protein
MLERLWRLFTLPWLLIVKEAWAERAATSGDLRMSFMDIRRPPHRDPEGLGRVLGDALAHLSQAKQGFGELVTSHLRMVLATDSSACAYYLPNSVWASTFQDQSRTNSYILACHLIWAATSIRLARDAHAGRRSIEQTVIAAAAWEAQQRFLRQFPGAEEWIDYMRPDLDPADHSGPGAA